VSSNYTGSPFAHRYKIEEDFDPQYGIVLVEYWNGPMGPILALYNSYKLSGIRAHTTHTGPKWEMTARIANSSADPNQIEVPVDRWSWGTQISQVSVWSDYPVIAAGTAWVGGMAGFRLGIENAIKNGTALAGGLSSIPVAVGVFNMLLRDITSYDIRRPTLSKTRTFSTAYGERFVIQETDNVYATSRLITDMSIPPSVQRQLPATPAGTFGAGFAWGWKVIDDHADTIPALSKIEETRTWAFGLWSVADYPTVGDYGFYIYNS